MPLSRARSEASGPARGVPVRAMPVRVMIIDDSITTRTVFARLVESDGELTVAATANSAEAALGLLETTVADVILLDLEMPGMGGLAALPRIIAASGGARILVVSSLTVEGAEQTLEALALGAADTFPKPAAGTFDTGYREMLLGRIRALGCDRIERTAAPPAARPPIPAPRPAVRAAEALAIGASTGGIHALGQLFRAMPRRIGMPIFVTQHLPASFMAVFARQLALASGREAVVAAEGMVAEPDRILIAPGDAHIVLRPLAGRNTGQLGTGQLAVRLDRTPAPTGCLPSVDPMFASLADCLGAGALGVVLSGMGRDGTQGAGRIVGAGGTVYAQDHASSAVWGMPRAVADAGLAAAVLPPEQIAGRIAAATGPAAERSAGRAAAWM